MFQLAGEGLGNFDIGEMAFDATFDHEYGEQEVILVASKTKSDWFISWSLPFALFSSLLLLLWSSPRSDHVTAFCRSFYGPFVAMRISKQV